jgi:sterol desaturase/sphingolipid hydroxylase (fatty acid hydroxylase superfamily)
MWAAHVVHHQSEDYNLGVALRQSALQPFVSMVFYWPLAVLGFPPAVFAACVSLNTIYQFWIHTRMIGRLGLLESFLMTPSHHRVHHGRNPIYIDRNHGATFIVWDKLFGTYQREEEEVAYGITTPLASWNPIWANVQYWAELWHSAQRTHRLRDKIAVFLKPPGWFPDDLGGFRPAPEIERPFVRFDTRYSGRMGAYAAFQFVQLLALLVALLALGADIGWLPSIACAAAIVWGLAAIGGLLESREWTHRLEWARVIATSLAWLIFVPALLVPALIVLNVGAAHLAGIRWRRALSAGVV